jgi:WD40 repeat protein
VITLKQNLSEINTLCRTEHYLYVGDEKCEVHRINVKFEKQDTIFTCPSLNENGIQSIAVNDKMIFIACGKKIYKVKNDDEKVDEINFSFSDDVSCLSIKSNRLYAISDEDKLVIFDIRDDDQFTSYPVERTGCHSPFPFSLIGLDESYCATGGMDCRICIWDGKVKSNCLLKEEIQIESLNGSINPPFVYDIDGVVGNELIVALGDGDVMMLKKRRKKKWKKKWRIQMHNKATIRVLKLDNCLNISASQNGTIVLFNDEGKVLRRIRFSGCANINDLCIFASSLVVANGNCLHIFDNFISKEEEGDEFVVDY